MSFAPAIAERLYADRADYRHNTPLQLNVEGVKLAGKTFSVRCSRKEGTKVLGSVQSCQQGLSQ